MSDLVVIGLFEYKSTISGERYDKVVYLLIFSFKNKDQIKLIND